MKENQPNINQSILHNNIIQFLRQENRSLASIDIISSISSKGFCYGLTLFKAYCDQQLDDVEDIYNAEWFKQTVEWIANYDSKNFAILDENEQAKRKKAFDEFITHTCFTQNISKFIFSDRFIAQSNAPEYLQEVSSKNKLREQPLAIMHNLVGYFTENTLTQYLKSLSNLPAGTSMQFIASKHALNLRYLGNSLFEFYDPNDNTWFTGISAEEICKKIYSSAQLFPLSYQKPILRRSN